MRLKEVIAPMQPRDLQYRSTRVAAARKALAHKGLQNFL